MVELSGVFVDEEVLVVGLRFSRDELVTALLVRPDDEFLEFSVRREFHQINGGV